MERYGILGRVGAYIRSRTPYVGGGSQRVSRYGQTIFSLPGEYDFLPLLHKGLWTNSTVALGLDWYSRNWSIPSLQVVKVDKDGIEEPIHDHPALSLLRRPHEHLSGEALSSSFIRDILCVGSSGIEKVYNRLGDVVELKPWHPLHVTAVFPEDGSEYLTNWKLTINGRDLEVRKERVIYSRKHIDPLNDRMGWSPLQSTMREIAVLDEASEYTASLLKNFCVPGMVASPKGDFTISDDDALMVKQKLKDTTTGTHRGDPVVLNGSYELVKAGFTPEEVGLHTLASPAQRVVLGAMGLNAEVLGLASDTGTYGSFADAIRAAGVHGMIPLQKLYAEELSHQLLIDFEDFDAVRAGRIKFSWDYAPVEELDDREQIAANRALRLYQGGVTTLNESRDIVGYGPSSSPDAGLLGIDKDKARLEAGLDQPAGGKVSEGDKLGGIKIPASGKERSKLEGERNSDSLSPSRSGVNKSFEPEIDSGVISETPVEVEV